MARRNLTWMVALTAAAGIGGLLLGSGTAASAPAPAENQLETKLSELEDRLTAVEAASFKRNGANYALAVNGAKIEITPTGEVRIESASRVSIRSNNKVDVDAALALNLKSGSSATLESASELTLKGGGDATLQAGSKLGLQASVVRLNKGSRPVARQNDKVAANKVAGGSTSVLVP